MPPVVNPNLCDGCTICVRSCPGDIIYFDKSSSLPIIRYPEECWHCGLCRIDCLRHLKKASAIDYFFPEEWIKGEGPIELSIAGGERHHGASQSKIGFCSAAATAFRSRAVHAYELDQKNTTLCGLDLRMTTLLRQRNDVHPTCATCRELCEAGSTG